MGPADLLKMWERANKKSLSASHRAQFLRSEEARLICLYEVWRVQEALCTSPKLSEVLNHLRGQAGPSMLGGKVPPVLPQPTTQASEKPQPRRTRSDRRGTSTSAWSRPADPGTVDPRYR